ncbi:hypothetical protein [Amycolatopsis sp. PS_44_ISF1]|uniref:hypothetical protein n=1 Tax=Amycolatopsis sp. PS_44_ISF1 TaxID=2974917 RepID=UPI0028DE7009|nr:hypothetical protein [Amycolatopsis sp. PS_44_ISF1]MDT8911936.1 hypothetical protein [Amycolatopsis sp. PS_44_ISF1]
MESHLLIGAPGAIYTARLVAITGDRLIHPADAQNDLARIVLRWARAWVPETWAARRHFDALGIGDGESPQYADRDVTGWLLLRPQPESLAAQVRSNRLDVATALAAEAEAWPG